MWSLQMQIMAFADLRKTISMQSDCCDPCARWLHHETNNYNSALKYYLPGWQTITHLTTILNSCLDSHWSYQIFSLSSVSDPPQHSYHLKVFIETEKSNMHLKSGLEGNCQLCINCSLCFEPDATSLSYSLISLFLDNDIIHICKFCVVNIFNVLMKDRQAKSLQKC